MLNRKLGAINSQLLLLVHVLDYYSVFIDDELASVELSIYLVDISWRCCYMVAKLFEPAIRNSLKVI